MICSLSECCHNVLKGNVPLTPAQKVKLRQHKHNLHKLATKKTYIKARKKNLQRGGFLGALITPILAYLASFLMEHAKKMFLVDPHVLEQLKHKESFEHEKLLVKKHSRSAEKKVTSASNLDIESVLSDNKITDDQKRKMYSAALNRYLSTAKMLKVSKCIDFLQCSENLFKWVKLL